MKISSSADHESEHDLYFLLTNLFILLDDTDRQFFGEFGLSTRQFWALHHLSQTESLSMIELSRLLLTDKSNVTAIADRLEAVGLITRSPAPQDRRVILLTLTPEGHRRHEKIFAAHQDRIRTLIGGNEETLRQLIRMLEPIRSRFEQYLQTRAPQASATQTTPASE